MDRRAWRAMVHRITKIRTQLKQLSSTVVFCFQIVPDLVISNSFSLALVNLSQAPTIMFLEYFLPYWNNKKPQVHLVCFLPQPQKPESWSLYWKRTLETKKLEVCVLTYNAMSLPLDTLRGRLENTCMFTNSWLHTYLWFFNLPFCIMYVY